MHQDAQPFGRQDGRQVFAVEGHQLVFGRQRGVVQQSLPACVPAAGDGLFVDPFDQRALGREVVVKQRVGDAQFGRQFAHLRFQAAAGEEVGSAFDDLLFAFTRVQATARRASGGEDGLAYDSAGLRGIDHLLNSAESVERLVNKPHPEIP